MKGAVVGLMGQKQSGKDTFAKRLIEEHGFTRIANADIMRDCLYALDPYIGDGWRLTRLIDTYGWDYAKEQNPEVRRLLQVFGTEVGREILGADTWVNATSRKVKAELRGGGKVVITDVRFPNEADMIHNLFAGDIIRIYRSGLPDADNHPSERAWREVEPDWEFHNDGTIEDLWSRADHYISQTKREENVT